MVYISRKALSKQKAKANLQRYNLDVLINLNNLKIASLILFTILIVSIPVRASKLHNASINGNLAKVKDIFKKNPQSINSQDFKGCTPLHYSVFCARIKITKFLLSRKALVNIKDNYGETPIFEACNFGLINFVKILQKNGSSINLSNNMGWTPLHVAVWKGHKKIVLFLIKKGAKVNVLTKKNESPLFMAKKRGYREIVKILQTHGAKN